jgi:hypothetical protein
MASPLSITLCKEKIERKRFQGDIKSNAEFTSCQIIKITENRFQLLVVAAKLILSFQKNRRERSI